MSYSSGTMKPRACGPGAMLRWIRGGLALLKKLSWEWWAASVAIFMAAAFMADLYPTLVFAFVAWGMVIGRGLLGVSEVLMKSPKPDAPAQWWGWSQASIPLLVAIALAVTALCILIPAELVFDEVPEPSGRPMFIAWAVFSWCGWMARPLGPMGLMGPLMDKGCPPLTAFALQLEAFQKNQLSLLGLLLMWVFLLFLLVFVPWVAVALLLWWPMVMRCAFADIFEDGIRIAQPVPARLAVPSVAQPIASTTPV